MQLIKCEQYSERWWESRRGVPTASEFGNIITPKKAEFSAGARGYCCQLIAEIYDADYGVHDTYVSAAMRNGTIMEPESRNYYEFHTDREVTQVGFCKSDCDRFGASPDSLVSTDGVLELKNPEVKTHIRWLLDGGLPADFKPQCHGHLIVTGRDYCDFMSYSAGLPKLLVRVQPDDYTKALADALEQFWELYQSMKARIADAREAAIDEAISRKGDQLPDNLKSFVA